MPRAADLAEDLAPARSRRRPTQRQLEDWQLANLREMRRQRDHAIATPLSLVSRLAKATSRAPKSSWLEAQSRRTTSRSSRRTSKRSSPWCATRPGAARQGAQPRAVRRADRRVQPGLPERRDRRAVHALGAAPAGLIREAIELQAQQPPLPIAGKFSAGKQRALAIEVMKALGFPFDRGRLDESEHPFTEGVPGDVRITTRFDATDPFTGLLGVLHETGQAMYDLGLPEAWRDQPVGPRSRHGARGEPVAAARDDDRPQPAVPRVLQPLLEKHFGVQRARSGSRRISTAPDPRAAQPDPRRRRRAHLSGAHHAALRAREADSRRRARGRGPAARPGTRGLEQRLGVAPGERRRRLPAGRALGGRLVRLFPFVRARRGDRRRSSTRACAPTVPDSTTRSRRGSSAACSTGCARTCTRVGASVSAQELIADATGKPLSAAPWLRYAEAKYLEEQASADLGTDDASPWTAQSSPRTSSTSANFNARLQARLRGLVGKAIADFAHDRGGRPGHGLPVRRQGHLHAARHPAVAAAQRAGATSSWSRSTSTRSSRAFPAHVLPDYLTALGVPFHIIEQDTYSVVKRVIPEGKTMCGLCSRLRRGALYRYAARERRHQDRARPPSRRHRRDALPQHVLRRQAQGDAAEAAVRRRPARRDPAARLRAPSATSSATRARGEFPIIPCNLCGSQENLQRAAVKKMLATWEREHPGRTESIFSALRNVQTSHLADPSAFDFAALDSQRTAEGAGEDTVDAPSPSHEPWESD